MHAILEQRRRDDPGDIEAAVIGRLLPGAPGGDAGHRMRLAALNRAAAAALAAPEGSPARRALPRILSVRGGVRCFRKEYSQGIRDFEDCRDLLRAGGSLLPYELEHLPAAVRERMAEVGLLVVEMDVGRARIVLSGEMAGERLRGGREQRQDAQLRDAAADLISRFIEGVPKDTHYYVQECLMLF